MKHPGILIAVALGGVVATLLAEAVPQSSPEARTAFHELSYHDHAPVGPLPSLLDARQFRISRAAFVARYLASQIKETLYQIPCYCPCSKSEGHQSLLNCFADKHGSKCVTCQEAGFCYLQTKKGRTPAENTTGHGAWRNAED
jgi:Protein of unknown function with PCYCGC motif